jgi:glycosyltransferase involved in cell wall biosynthesis
VPLPVRVLFVAHSFPRHPGDAAGSFVHRLALALQRDGIAVRVVAPSGHGLPREEAVDGVEVARYRYAPARWETLAYGGTMAEQVAGSWHGRAALVGLLGAGSLAVARERRRWRADVIHAHWWFPAAVQALSLGAAGRAPLVLTLHGSDVRLARGIGAARAAFAGLARRASALSAVSSWLCDEARAMAPSVGCEVAPMPVAASLFTPASPPVARRGVLFVGRLNEQKGLRHLLEALARGSSSMPLTVLGEGPDAAALHALAARLGVDDRVTWHGRVLQSQLADHYRAARALVVPSREEGLGLVVAEAALCGTPSVAFESGGLPDVVGGRDTGWLVPPGDVDALARTLDDVERADVDAVGARARERALARFSPEAAAARYRTIYERALALGRQRHSTG